MTEMLADTEVGPPSLDALLDGYREHLAGWLAAPRSLPLPPQVMSQLEGCLSDLDRRLASYRDQRPLLVIVLMGGTGVGKSTLLNALAGASIAQASFIRPTTREPVVYLHESIRPDRLDANLRACRLHTHNRPNLVQKVLVDTPDLDSNDTHNRQVLEQALQTADIALYVGSQEKYHDQLGWKLFREQRQKRAFAFVLNKWDRCSAGLTGARPDEDLLADLQREGFSQPKLFRVCAQSWLDRALTGVIPELPEGEQFLELVSWLEEGITFEEISAIKSRGIEQLLARTKTTLEANAPPIIGKAATETAAAWETTLAEEAGVTGTILLQTIEPYQSEIEHHFASRGRQGFRGPMALYLGLLSQVLHFGSALRSRFGLFTKGPAQEIEAASWDLGRLTAACSGMAHDGQLDARARALQDKLLLQARDAGFPMDWLHAEMSAPDRIRQSEGQTDVLRMVLERVEADWTRPKGPRWLSRTILHFLAEWLPLVTLFAACVMLLYRYFVLQLPIGWVDLAFPLVAVLAVLVLMHVLIVVFLPVHWSAIRGRFEKELCDELGQNLRDRHGGLPTLVAEKAAKQRHELDRLLKELEEIQQRLSGQAQASGVDALYGSEG